LYDHGGDENYMAFKAGQNKEKSVIRDYLYIAPAVLLVAIYFISSILYTFFLSFHDWDGVNQMMFCGIDNYRSLFADSNFLISVGNTLIWVVSSLVISVLLPLLLAIMITKSSFAKLFTNVFYFPTAISATVSGVIMATLLSTYGIPYLFGLMGHPEMVKDWLAVPYVNTFVMILTGIWQGIGLNLVLYVAAFRNVDLSPVEAAMIDGVGAVKMYTKVILPLIRPTIIVVLLMSLVNSFKVFDGIWVMTKGGPYRSSETLALTMYEESFIYNRYGRGAAVAIVLTVVILIVSYFNLKNTFRED
jgi:multiple sugar transport system permease protein